MCIVSERVMCGDTNMVWYYSIAAMLGEVPQYNLELQFRCYIDEVNVNGVDFSVCVSFFFIKTSQ